MHPLRDRHEYRNVPSESTIRVHVGGRGWLQAVRESRDCEVRREEGWLEVIPRGRREEVRPHRASRVC